MDIRADGSIVMYKDSEDKEYIFETNGVELGGFCDTYYRPEPGTFYKVYRNITGHVYLKLCEFQHERVLTDICYLPDQFILEKYNTIKSV